MRPPAAALLLSALLLACAVAPAPAQAASRSGFGLDVISPIGASPARLHADLDVARRAGVSMVRFEVEWARLEPRRGEIDASAVAQLDLAAAAARRRGLRLFVLFLRSPCWASSAPRGAPCDAYGPRDPADAVPAATFVARRYAAQAAAFEVWNEPDHSNELYWAGPDKVRRYVALARALYRPLKQAAPRVPVLAGAFVGTNGAWLQALYDQGIAGHYDALSVHFYDLTLTSLRTLRQTMRRNGDSAPVWIGETGWSSCLRRARSQTGHVCVNSRTQAQLTADLVRVLRRTPWVRGAVFYTARDDVQYDFGLVTRSGRAKPVLRALRSELRARRPRPTRRVVLRLVPTSSGLRVTGTGPGADLFVLQATGRRVRVTGFLRLGPRGRFSARLPRALGTRGVTVRVRHQWTGRTAVRRR